MSHVPEKQRTWAEIDLARLERNLRRIRAALPDHLRYIAVVKADAYGHGLPAVASRLMRSGADAFAVANLSEALAIREIGTGWPILILSPILPAEVSDAVAMQVIPVVSSIEEAGRLNAEAQKRNTTVEVQLKVDTGMGRLGVWHPEAIAIHTQLQRLTHLRLSGLCTHFAAAGSDPEYTQLQRERFLAVCAPLSDEERSGFLIHADNSAGIDSFPLGGIFNATRIGLLQFGIRPHAASLLNSVEVEPVFSFHTRVGLVKKLPKGCPISYGLTYRMKTAGTVAILTAGYGDGIPTSLSNCGEVLIRGTRCPILGRVTMDQTIVDVSHLKDLSPGELATMVGSQEGETIDASTYARLSGQIEWEFFCSITKRVARFYRLDTAI